MRGVKGGDDTFHADADIALSASKDSECHLCVPKSPTPKKLSTPSAANPSRRTRRCKPHTWRGAHRYRIDSFFVSCLKDVSKNRLRFERNRDDPFFASCLKCDCINAAVFDSQEQQLLNPIPEGIL